MTTRLATVLQIWRQESMYAKDGDLLFPSYRLEGRQPRLGSMIVEDYVRPASVAGGLLEERDGSFYYGGELVTQFGFHNLRHGLGTCLAGQGTDPVVIQRMLRHSSQKLMEHYIHPKARGLRKGTSRSSGSLKSPERAIAGPHAGPMKW